MNSVLVRREHTRTARYRSPPNGRVVIEDRADANHTVRPVDDFPRTGGADLAPVNAGELRVILRKEAFGSGHDRDATAECIGKLNGLLLRLRSAQLAADQQDGLLSATQKFGRRRDGGA